jgi:hypothetical protein
VAKECVKNILVKDGLSEDAFVLIDTSYAEAHHPCDPGKYESGELPAEDGSGNRFLKVPINGL